MLFSNRTAIRREQVLEQSAVNAILDHRALALSAKRACGQIALLAGARIGDVDVAIVAQIVRHERHRED